MQLWAISLTSSWYSDEYKTLSEKFIDRYVDKLDWMKISKYQNLSEQFIEKHADKLNWNLISEYQNLSEEFIERNADKLDWYKISQYQKLSEQADAYMEYAKKEGIYTFTENYKKKYAKAKESFKALIKIFSGTKLLTKEEINSYKERMKRYQF